MAKTTCLYCGRNRSTRYMIPSLIYRGRWICKQDVTTCLRLRAGATLPTTPMPGTPGYANRPRGNRRKK